MKNLLFGFIFLFIVVLCIYFGTRKENKEELAKYYNISKPTLNKWVKYFPSAMTLKEWNKKRKLTGFESEGLKSHFGTNAGLVLNKSQIAEEGSACNKTLTKYVVENLEKIGLTEEAWKKCSVFPPVICERIIDLLIGKSEPTLEERLASVTNKTI